MSAGMLEWAQTGRSQARPLQFISCKQCGVLSHVGSCTLATLSSVESGSFDEKWCLLASSYVQPYIERYTAP